MRDEFDLDPSVVYLNSGTHSIVPRAVLQAAELYRREYERNPTEGLNRVWGRLWSVQKNLAEFFHANPKDIFLRHNVTSVMNVLILGMPLPAAGEILTSDLEYGAVANIARLRAVREGREFRSFRLPATREECQGLDEEALAGQVIRELRPETRMLLLSHVTTGTGLVLPIERIAAETRRRGIVLVVDGAHSSGFLDLDFRKLQDVDLYAVTLHKWMMGPKGTSFGWVAPRHQEIIQPIVGGWTSFETPEGFGAFGGGSRFQAKFLFSECYDFSTFLALQDTLDFWKRVGPEKIRGRIHDLQNYTDRAMSSELGWKPLSPPPGPLLGPLLSYETPERIRAEGRAFMMNLHEKERVQLVVTFVHGQPALRISPHVYNLESEIDRAVSALKRY